MAIQNVNKAQIKVKGCENSIKERRSNYRKKRGIPSINVLENYVLKSIVGQDNAVRQIVTAIYKAIEFKSIKTNLLILGGSGTGKTEIVTQIAKRLHLPYTIEDATKYTKEGYMGDDVEDMLYNLIENARGDIRKAQNGIIIIDEIDKKVSGRGDISGTDVLKSMLRIIQGTKIKITTIADYGVIEEEFDTSNIIVIFMGAFSGIKEIRDERLQKSTIGFKTHTQEKEDQLTSKYTKKDLVEYGMPEEFMGRIDTIVETRHLDEKDLCNILRKSQLSIFKKYKKELSKKGISLEYSKTLLSNIAKVSLELDTGAREL